jgi:hypothetical protein
MKITIKIFTIIAIIAFLAGTGCSSGPKERIEERENKGTEMGVSTPDWVRAYTMYGLARLQSQVTYRDKYCVIGEETGANLQFVQAWADHFSAQQRIGSTLRETVEAEYAVKLQAYALSAGITEAVTGEGGLFQQQVDNVLSVIVSVTYTGAQREADWWTLRRRYDPEEKDAYTDAYTVYVLYTVPKAELNRQVAAAMETTVSAESVFDDITIDLAREILQNGLPNWGAPPQPAAKK